MVRNPVLFLDSACPPVALITASSETVNVVAEIPSLLPDDSLPSAFTVALETVSPLTYIPVLSPADFPPVGVLQAGFSQAGFPPAVA